MLRRGSVLTVLALIAATLFGATAPHAKAYPEDKELEYGRQILEFVCEDDGNAPRSRIWYRTHSDIQQQAPYDWKGYRDYNPMKDTLQDLYGDSDFTPVTRRAMCSDLQKYTTQLKSNVIDHKGDVKACCATEEGMKAFFDKKIDDQIANNEKQREAIDDPERFEDEHKGNDTDLEYLNMWICKDNDSYC
ncbi:hypothetical protein [Nocardia brasiliensis]|uniref:hypothetical protein n=1 Tax=Nocardia brasiliensis TaxID=37326 RepID=UPI0024540AB6|nr:hypothetical protein [Nocardia brasiliensis]